MRPKDEEMLREFLGHISAQDLRLRFFAHPPLQPCIPLRLTQLDFARAMAFVALDEASGEPVGWCGCTPIPTTRRRKRRAGALRSQRTRHGWMLMELIIRYGRSENLKRIEGQVLQENTSMLEMCRELGFEICEDPSDYTVKLVRLELRP